LRQARISNPTFDSELKNPISSFPIDGPSFATNGVPSNYATLRLILRYKLIFADSKNQVPGVISRREGRFVALDANSFAHPILDWDAGSRSKFTMAFERGEKIFDKKFILKTPPTYRGFSQDPLTKFRPTVACLFTVAISSSPHVTIIVVRLDRNAGMGLFTAAVGHGAPGRTALALYDDSVPWTKTLGHELGHSLGMPHIKAMLGDPDCNAHGLGNEDRCYGETFTEMGNIMGRGKELWVQNALPWLRRIALHTITTGWEAQLWGGRQPPAGPASWRGFGW
jgi:hypothetical protein